MKHLRSVFIPLFLLSLGHTSHLVAQNAQPKRVETTAPASSPLSQKAIASYKPKLGLPDLREMKPMRDFPAASDGMKIQLLTPLQDADTMVCTTVKPAPALYWHQSKAVTGKIEIAITDVNTMMPVFKYRHKGEVPAGLNRLDLAKHKIILETGRVYKWSVIYHMDRASPSANLVQSSTLMRIEGKEPDSSTGMEARTVAYSGLGAWLDVTDILAGQFQAHRDDAQAVQDLASWLRASGITTAP